MRLRQAWPVLGRKFRGDQHSQGRAKPGVVIKLRRNTQAQKYVCARVLGLTFGAFNCWFALARRRIVALAIALGPPVHPAPPGRAGAQG